MKNFKKILFVLVLLVAGAIFLAACVPKKDPTEPSEPTVTESTGGKTVVPSETTPGPSTAPSTAPSTTPTEIPVDKTQLKGLLDTHYEDTLAKQGGYVITEDIILDLVAEIGDFSVTWTSNNVEVINPETGQVTRREFTDGNDVSVVLTAKAAGQNDVFYIVKVEELPLTLDQQLEAELARLTRFDSSTRPYLKIDLPLDELKDVYVDGEKVTTATWTSSDPDYISHDGKRQEIEFEGEKDVTFTVTFTYQDITKTKSVTFTILGIRIYTNFYELVSGPDKAAKGDVFKVRNVSKYKDTNDGTFLIDELGYLLFTFGKDTKLTAGNLYDMKAEYDLYYGTPQFKGQSYELIAGGTANTEPKIVEITIEELVALPVPSDNEPLLNLQYKVTGAKIHLFASKNSQGGVESYKTFLVPQTHNDPTKEPNKSDSLMMYYQSPGGLAILQALADGDKSYSPDLEYIVINVNAFRTNNDIYAFMYLHSVDNQDFLMLSLTPEEAADVALKGAASKLPSHVYFDGQDLVLPAKATFGESEFDVTYVSNDVTLIGHDGKITFPALDQIKTAKITLSTVVGDKTITVEKDVKVGRPASITIDAAVAKAVNDLVAFEAFFYVGINGTYQFLDGSLQGAAVRFTGVDLSGLDFGKKYIVVATKAADYSGLRQMNGVAYFELSETDPINAVPFTGELTQVELAKVMNSVISVPNMVVQSKPSKDSNGVLTYTLRDSAGNTMAVREHHTNLERIAAIEALELQNGDLVNVTSIIVSWFNAPQFIHGHLEKVTVTDEMKLEIAKGSLVSEFDGKVFNMDSEIVLPVLGDYGVAIAWEINPIDAIADGKWKVVTENTPVVLTATLTLGENAPVVVELDVTIKFVDSSATIELLKTIDFGSVAKTGYAAGQLEFVNGDGVSYSFNKDRVQTNTSTFAPHGGAGEPFAVFSIRDTHSEAWMEFDVEAGVVMISFEINVWNNTLIDTVKDTPNGLFILQYKNGATWENVKTTNGEENLLPLLEFEKYVEVKFETNNPGLYRIIYSGTSTATGNTTHATTVDNIKFYVLGAPAEHTVTFDVDGGLPAIAPVTVESGAKVTKPANPTKEGFAFMGWWVGEFLFDFDTAITADIILVAKWEVLQQKNTIDFGNEAVTGYNAGLLNFTNGDGVEYSLNKDRVQINTSTFAPHNGGIFAVFSIRNTHSEAWMEFDVAEGVVMVSFEINVWNNTLLQDVKDTPDGLFILQYKNGSTWENVKTTNNEDNLLSLLTFEEYVKVSFDIANAGLYRIIYSGNSTATGNTTTAVTVDNITFY